MKNQFLLVIVVVVGLSSCYFQVIGMLVSLSSFEPQVVTVSENERPK